MIEYLKGRLISSLPMKTVIEVNGVGYRLHMPLSSYAQLPQSGKEVTIYVSEVIREDQYELFGFLEPIDREIFEKLSSVSGIGPKTALSIIGHLDSSELQLAIKSSNVTLLSKVPGIGKKTAERLIIDMRDKVDKLSVMAAPKALLSDEEQMTQDGIAALINLGYNPLKASAAIKKAGSESSDLSTLIREALQAL